MLRKRTAHLVFGTVVVLPVVLWQIQQSKQHGTAVDEERVIFRTFVTTVPTSDSNPLSEPVGVANNANNANTADRPDDMDQMVDEVYPRAFEPWPPHLALPCFPPDGNMTQDKVWEAPSHKSPADRGLFYVKTYKTASSTCAGVNLRIARNEARRRHTHNASVCRARFAHGPAYPMYPHRNLAESFLWAVIRHPTQRVLSQYFHFHVSKGGNEAGVRFRAYLSQTSQIFSTLKFLHPHKKFNRRQDNGYAMANEILRAYNFVGLAERLDESLVILSMLARVPLSDVLYLSAKLNGGYDAHCVFLQPANVTAPMQHYLEGATWQTLIQYDLALVQAVTQSMELTIDRLGRRDVERQLALYRAALQKARDRCAHQTVFPCMNGSQIPLHQTDCMWLDSACGMDCLDGVAQEMGIDQTPVLPGSLQRVP